MSLWPILVSSFHVDPFTLGMEQVTPKLSGLKNEHFFSHESLVCVGIGGDTWCLPITASAGEA